MQVKVEVKCDIPAGRFAIDQVRGMFDLKAEKVCKERFTVELPDEAESWQIGVIVGPSGSGKTTVARAAYGKRFIESIRWDKKQAVVEQFGTASIKDITRMLSSVGFSSPPSWIKPHHVLSGGERFRCDLARALLMPGELVAFDEFTSVVDRTVAKVGSAAIAKSIRKGHIQKRFVAVTCHYDVLDWLQPDWVLDMASGQLARGCLYRRPPIELAVIPCHHSVWEMVRRHHYLSHYHAHSAACFAATWNGALVAFSSWRSLLTSLKDRNMREHRTVVLPDYQGLGLGNRLSELIASYWKATGVRALSTTSHPSMIHHRQTSPLWRTIRAGLVTKPGNGFRSSASMSCDRFTGSFEFIGPPMARAAVHMIDQGRRDLFATDRRALDILHHATGAAVSVRVLAKRTGLRPDTVRGIVSALVKAGRLDSCAVSKTRLAYVATERESANCPGGKVRGARK